MSADNPLLGTFSTPFSVPPFSDIHDEHYLPAIESAIESNREEIRQIAENPEKPTFENTIEALETTGESLDTISAVLFNLNAAETTDELQKITQGASEKLTAFSNEIKQNTQLFDRIAAVHDQIDTLDLSKEQRMLLEKTYKGFVRNGAALDDDGKKRFKDISMELSKLTLTFGENVLAETNDFQLVIDNEADLKGLPKDVIGRAAATAEEAGQAGKWVFTLQAPSYIPFMEYADNRALRERMFRAFMSKGSKDNVRNNTQLVTRIAQLRAQLAGLFGYGTYAEYVLEERMAKKPGEVLSFLDELLDKSVTKAREEVEELQAFIRESGEDFELERWDWAYYSEKLKQKKYAFDDEQLKPYFKLENVIDGVFQTAEKLYDITFQANADIPVYHPDVQAYEVWEGNEVKAVFLADFFPRKGKRPGAWMTSYRDERRTGERKVLPIVSIVCNFTPSSPDHPSLLKFDEVKTLFHEFGHALHGMLADTIYASLSGTSVFWDFVELPSQIFENWCFEKECLDLFAHHFETGELIPTEFIEKIKAASTYHEAYATVRQVSFGLLDMAYHHRSPEELGTIGDVESFEKKVMSGTELFPPVSGAVMSVQFSHIFAGGYAAGYYSYKWAEVLDADAFSLFLERGIFDKKTAESFKENILSRGGTEHPMDLYKRFRGQEPTPEALLKRAGLLE